MTRTTIITLYWKEWRGDAGVLAAMAAALLLVRIVTWGLSLSPHAPEAALSLMAAMLGARLFAGERETGTHAFLMGLPASAAEVWRAKVDAAFSWLALLYVMTYAGADVARLLITYPSHIATPYALCAAPILFLGLAALASSVLDNTMLAFVAGVVFGYASLLIVTAIGMLIAFLFWGDEPLLVVGAVGMLLLATLIYLLMAAACLLASWVMFRSRVREP